MNRNEVLEEVRRLVAEQAELETDKVRDSTALSKLCFDSLDYVELMLNIERKFSIRFDKSSYAETDTVPSIADAVMSLLPKSE
jgi:acyl carrier protein